VKSLCEILYTDSQNVQQFHYVTTTVQMAALVPEIMDSSSRRLMQFSDSYVDC
jgi:hypothetical protein